MSIASSFFEVPNKNPEQISLQKKEQTTGQVVTVNNTKDSTQKVLLMKVLTSL